MKRVNGLWYVKFSGVWLIAGKDIHSAIQYSERLQKEF